MADSPANKLIPLLEGLTSPSLCVRIAEIRVEEIDVSRGRNASGGHDLSMEPGTASHLQVDEVLQDGYIDDTESDVQDPFLFRGLQTHQSDLSPLQNIDVAEAKRLTGVFDDVVNSMYPLVSARDLSLMVDSLS